MAATLDAIRDCSRELLDQLRSGAEVGTLTKLVAERESQIRQFFEDAARPGAVAAEVKEALLALDSEVSEELRSRRDELSQELAALRQARSAESAYRHDATGQARFLDRAT
jgi:DNA phosphorothioation-dependent restriction protein DptG